VTSPVVVTGASGFIGRHLVAHLSARRIPVIALTRRAGFDECAGVRSHVVCAYSDFGPPPDSILVHLAEPPHIASVDQEGERHVARMREQGVALLARGYTRAIYVSSSTVYGDREETPRRPGEILPPPTKVYSQAKLQVERVFLDANQVVARATNVYGPRMSENTIFSDILKQLAGSGPVLIREATPVRDYLWVEDAAEALAAMARGNKFGIYNVASGHSVSCEDLAGLILRESGQSGRPVVASLPPRRSVLRLDISTTFDDFGWRPATDLQAGISKLLTSGPA
jgi:nucleoside-diphosphate-sugar epimerase